MTTITLVQSREFNFSYFQGSELFLTFHKALSGELCIRR